MLFISKHLVFSNFTQKKIIPKNGERAGGGGAPSLPPLPFPLGAVQCFIKWNERDDYSSQNFHSNNCLKCIISFKGQSPGADGLLVAYSVCKNWCCHNGRQYDKSFSRFHEKTVYTKIYCTTR